MNGEEVSNPNAQELSEFEKRREIGSILISNHNDHIPVIVEKELDSKLPELNQKKYLVPHNMTVGAFIFAIRRKISLESFQSLFIITKDQNYTPPLTMTMVEIYQKYHSPDKCLYLIYKSENRLKLILPYNLLRAKLSTLLNL